MTEKKAAGRLAMRVEGENWNAYCALQETMDGAIPIGSISLNAVRNYPACKQAFLDLMISIVSEIIRDITGETPTWTGPEPAPEHERAGRT
jgi:hypothetical protein